MMRIFQLSIIIFYYFLFNIFRQKALELRKKVTKKN